MMATLRIQAELWRWRFDLRTGTTKEERLDERNTEFPTMDRSVLGRRSRYAWNVLMGSAARHEPGPHGTHPRLGPPHGAHEPRREAGAGSARRLALVLPELRRTVEDAWRRAGLVGIDDVDAVELHDCFTITEYVRIEHLGLAPVGAAWRAVDSGRIHFGGKTPVNPSGGLIGGGHPVGASGVRMLLDAARQVTGRAEDAQVAGARTAQTLNIGGSATTTVSFVVGL